MPLPGRLAGASSAFVVQWPGATSVSAGPSAGTSAAVNLLRTSMHGVVEVDADFSCCADGAEQPANSTRPA
ncbi:MAG TPA: hypothetical protein VGI88_04960, partial [Verrucomicrobiae bacterium]